MDKSKLFYIWEGLEALGMLIVKIDWVRYNIRKYIFIGNNSRSKASISKFSIFIKESGTLNFQSRKNEANDLQSTNNEQATNYSPNLVNSSLKNLVTPYYFYSQLMFMLL